jgi:sulfite exporter TauE/SafE
MSAKENRPTISFIPTTRGRCVMSLVVGLIVIAAEGVNLATDTVHSPFLPILAVVAGALMIITALIGLASPQARGH